MTHPPLTAAQTACYAKVMSFVEQICHIYKNDNSEVDHRTSQILKTKIKHRIRFTAREPIINLVISNNADNFGNNNVGNGIASLPEWQLRIEIAPWLEDRSLIRLWAWLTETEVRQETMLLYLLRKNEKFHFGGFSMAEHDRIRFQVSLLGETCEINEFALALAEVINAIDYYSAEIDKEVTASYQN